MKLPQTIKQVQSFVGLATYYRKFIEHFISIASPLYQLTEKGVKFIKTFACHDAFEKLKEIIVSNMILALPDFNKEFVLMTVIMALAPCFRKPTKTP